MPTFRFLYHANAVGFSGQITRPLNQLIESQAASSLSPAGGYSSARRDAYKLLEILSHDGATSEVTGSDNPSNGNHEAKATATIQNLNIGNVVLLESGTAYLSSVHPADGSQAQITPQGSFFKNLRVAGREILLESKVDLYSKLNTLEKLSNYYKDNDEFRNQFLAEAFVGHGDLLHENQRKYFPWCNIKDTGKLPVTRGTGVAIVPLFRVKNPSEPGFQVSGNAITVDNFGTIILGELVIDGYERRLTMLHADLGSPTAGSAGAASVVTNGTTTDPP